MPIRPKHTLGQCRLAASRQFTDRDDFQELFHKALRADRSDDPHVVVYYGVGGVGKTSLRRKLCEYLDSDSGAVYSVVDFDIPAHCGQEMALSVLRREFRSRYRVPFNTFDIAHAVYWQKAKPDVALKKETFPFWEEGAIVADLVALLGDAPAVGWIPKLAKMAGTGSKLIETWWTKRGNEELRGLPALDAVQIAERLPMFWAADVRDYLATKGVRGVIFLDTYEALTEGERSEGKLLQHDAWVRELVAQLPEVLWVICGREKLRWAEMDPEWEKSLDQHLVGNLAVADAEQFLVSCGIDDPAIREAIVDGSQGLPYYLDLAVDTYLQIAEAAQRAPVPTDFARTPTDVFARFLRHLTQPEVETLKVLSVPRFWTRELFELLVKEFHTGYPITAFDDLCRFSFISEDAARGTWSMHQLMRQSLREHLAATAKRVQSFMFDTYRGRLAGLSPAGVSAESIGILAEALYHGGMALESGTFVDWYGSAVGVFLQAKLSLGLQPISEDAVRTAERIPGITDMELAKVLRVLGFVYEGLGRYGDAKCTYERALRLVEKGDTSTQRVAGELMSRLAGVLHRSGDYDRAGPLFSKALQVLEGALGPTHIAVVQTLTKCGYYHKDTGNYTEAESLLRRALALSESLPDSGNLNVAYVCGSLGNLCIAQGRYEEAESLFSRALAVEERRMGADSAGLAPTINSIAEMRRQQGRLAEAEPLFLRALSLEERASGAESPLLAYATSNLAELYLAMGRLDEADVYALKALRARQEFLAPGSREVADSMRIVAQVHLARGRLVDAERFGLESLATHERIGSGDDRYAAQAMIVLGRIYLALGRHDDAEPYYTRALGIVERMVGAAHPETALVLNELVAFYRATGRTADAQALAERAERIRAHVESAPDSPRKQT